MGIAGCRSQRAACPACLIALRTSPDWFMRFGTMKDLRGRESMNALSKLTASNAFPSERTQRL